MVKFRSEKAHQNEALVAVSALPNTMVWRNNTGKGWVGKRMNTRVGQTVVIRPGMTVLFEAQPIAFGCPGSGDILGIYDGRPLSLEMKREDGVQEDTQEKFEKRWTEVGGLYVIARSADEAVDKLILSSVG